MSERGQTRPPVQMVRRPGQAAPVASPTGGEVAYLASGGETGGTLTFLEAVSPPGDGPPLHVHLDADEFVWVLEGSLRFQLGDVVHEAPTGSFLFIPRGVRHTWENDGHGDVRFLFGFTPASLGMERFFRRGAELDADARLTDAFENFAREAEMEVVGPPLRQSSGS